MHLKKRFGFDSVWTWLSFFAILKLSLHLLPLAWSDFGWFRDELYYLACADHLAWGFVDHPPLSVFVLAGWKSLFGDSLVSLRVASASVGAGVVVATGYLAHALGGGRYATAVAALASLVCGATLAFSSFWSMNVLDLLLVASASLILIRLVQGGGSFLWLLLGLVLGLALLNKVGTLWIGLGVLVGILASPERKWLKTPWPWLAGVLSVAIFMPYILWNVANDWAHLAFIESAVSGKYSGLTTWSFLQGQFLMQNPVTAPLWISGLAWLLLSKEGRRYRILGVVWIVACVVLVANGQSKAGYLAPAYPALFAAGAVAWERWLADRSALRVAVVTGLALGIAFAPMATPILSAGPYIAYSRALGFAPSTDEGHELAELPQFYADRFGWKEKAAAVAAVVHTLPEHERSKTLLFAHNYGRSGALDYFKDEFDLPRVAGNHNNYWLWGPGETDPEILIVLGGDREDLEGRYESVELAGIATCDYCIPYERDLPIHLCRDPKQSLRAIWPEIGHYN